jgi:Carbohydrate esterase 2 N-terminal
MTAVTDPGFYFSPLNWVVGGGQAVSNCAGSYFYFNFTGTSCSFGLNTTNLSSNALYVRTSIDGAPFVDTNISGLSSLVVGTGLSNTLHSIVCYYRGRTASADSWNTPVNGLIVTGATLSAGATTSAPTVRPKVAMFYGDSRVEGTMDLGSPNTASVQDTTITSAFLLGEALNAEIGLRAFGGMDYTISGNTNVPPLFTPGNDAASSWNKAYSGQSILSSGLLSPQPNYVFVLDLGINGRAVPQATEQAAALGFMQAIRLAAPQAYVFIGNGSYEGLQAVAISAAYSAYQALGADAKMVLLNYNLSASEIASINVTNPTSPTIYSYEGEHPNQTFQAIIAARILPSVLFF